jgi:hypothetical protein
VAVVPAVVSTPIELPAVEAKIQVVTEPKDTRSEDYLPLTDSKNIERFINDYFADIPIMTKIAKCESRYRHIDVRTGDVLRGVENSLDRGVMQVNLYYHERAARSLGLDLHNIDDNVAYARHLYEKQGTRPWNSSSPCWGRYVGVEIATR